jgi:hypothetical protein
LSERGYDHNFPNPYSSVSDQSMLIVDNYNTISTSMSDGKSSYMYDNGDCQPFKPDDVKLKARNIESSDEEFIECGRDKLHGMHINILTRETKWNCMATPVVVHNDRPFHPINNSIEYGTPINQFTQHHPTNTGNLNPQFIAPNSNGQVRTMFQSNDEERIAPESIELGIIALLQANVMLNLQMTVPMPKSFYDRNGVE